LSEHIDWNEHENRDNGEGVTWNQSDDNNDDHQGVDQSPAAEEKPSVQSPKKRQKRSGGGTNNVLSWSDVGAVFDFAERFSALGEDRTKLFCSLFDIPEDSHVIDVAQALYPSGGEIAAFAVVTDIVTIMSNGVVGFSEGIKLVTKIDALPDLTTKTVARQVSSITGADIKHRKNSQTTEFVSSVFEALDKTRESGKLEQLVEFHELLEVWPGNKR
jgi:hypothetical protein